MVLSNYNYGNGDDEDNDDDNAQRNSICTQYIICRHRWLILCYTHSKCNTLPLNRYSVFTSLKGFQWFLCIYMLRIGLDRLFRPRLKIELS